ncbi:MAG: AAA family ATPase [Nitrososphaerota archaeon]
MQNMFKNLQYLKVRLNNIRTFQDKEFEFYKGINLIVGNNGTGKSTLVSSPYIGMYGRVPSSTITLKKLITRGEKRGEIEVILEDTEYNKLQIRREYPNLTEIYLNNTKLSSIDEVFDSEVMKLIYANLLDKIDFTSYINLDDYYEKMKKVKDLVEKEIASIQSEITSCEFVITNYQNQSIEKQNQRQQYSDELTIIKSTIDELIKSLPINQDEILEKYTQLNYIMSNFIQLKNKFLEEKRQSINLEIMKNRQEIGNIQNQYNIEVQELQNYYSNLLNEIQNKYNLEIASLQGNISNIDTQLTKLQNLHSLPNSTCPVCNSKVDKVHLEKEMNNLITEKNKVISEIKRLEKERDDEIALKRNEYLDKVEQIKSKYLPSFEKLNHIIDTLTSQLNTISITNDDVAISYGYSSYSQLINKYNIVKKQVTDIDNLRKYQQKLDYYTKFIESLDNEILKLQKDIQNITKKKKQLENKLTEKLITKDILDRLLDKKKIRQFVLSRIVDKINTLSSVITDLPIKLTAYVDDEKVGIIFKNSYGSEVQFEELSSGEKVVGIIISLFIYRKLLESLNCVVPKIIIFDELLDRLDYNNVYNVLYFLSKLDDHIILIVTHREDIIQLSEEIEMNVIRLN